MLVRRAYSYAVIEVRRVVIIGRISHRIKINSSIINTVVFVAGISVRRGRCSKVQRVTGGELFDASKLPAIENAIDDLMVSKIFCTDVRQIN